MTTLNSKINTTINTLASLGFVCESLKDEVNKISSLQEDTVYPKSDRIHSITIKHKTLMVFCVISVNYWDRYDSEIDTVTYKVADSASPFATADFRYAGVSNSVKSISERATKAINLITKREADLKSKCDNQKNRLPIVIKELQSIFGDVKVNLNIFNQSTVTVLYKDLELNFDINATSDYHDLDLYTLPISFGRGKTRQFTAKQIKVILDLN